MYSMVLMMAMSTSPEAAACHKTVGCTGCTGAVVVATGCTGCHGGLFGGKGCNGGSCHGGLFGGKGCNGGCHGGLFSGFRKHGCHGSSCNGCDGGAGCNGAGCVGTPVQVVPVEEKKVMPKEEKKGGVTFAPVAPAYVTVNVPADAKVTIDGNATISTSTVRIYATPSLKAGTVHYYTFTAEVVRGGQTYSATEKVAVEAGTKTEITLNPNVGPAVASK